MDAGADAELGGDALFVDHDVLAPVELHHPGPRAHTGPRSLSGVQMTTWSTSGSSAATAAPLPRASSASSSTIGHTTTPRAPARPRAARPATTGPDRRPLPSCSRATGRCETTRSRGRWPRRRASPPPRAAAGPSRPPPGRPRPPRRPRCGAGGRRRSGGTARRCRRRGGPSWRTRVCHCPGGPAAGSGQEGSHRLDERFSPNSTALPEFLLSPAGPPRPPPRTAGRGSPAR